VGLALSLGACGEEGPRAGTGSLAAADDTTVSVSQQGSDAGAPITVDDLDCPHGGKVGQIEVVFDCSQITTVSCKDLSNVVVELADGSRQRFEGLNGQRGVFTAQGRNAVITRVWVKAGANHSGDGPGYGERFDAPAQDCPLVPPGDAGCFVADGTCNPTPPARDAGCFVADGICDYVPTPPKPPQPPQDGPIGY
jgi:hypothetical protein